MPSGWVESEVGKILFEVEDMFGGPDQLPLAGLFGTRGCVTIQIRQSNCPFESSMMVSIKQSLCVVSQYYGLASKGSLRRYIYSI